MIQDVKGRESLDYGSLKSWAGATGAKMRQAIGYVLPIAMGAAGG
jgi:hypothetical protein